MYTTKFPGPDSEENANEIGSDGEKELYPRLGCMHDAENENIYQLRVERADRNRRIYAEAQFKDVSTQTWANLTARISTYKVFNDDEDWEI